VRNDDSLVMRVRSGDVEIVLTGDISREAEATLPDEADPPPLRLIKVPHHGSSTSSSTPFLRTFLPQAAIISVGRANTFGHPAAGTLERYEALGVEVFRTDRDGAVIIETDGHEVHVHTVSGRSWTLTATRN
jgi:competence protein ComEC